MKRESHTVDQSHQVDPSATAGPSFSTTGLVVVTVDGHASNGVTFTEVDAPAVWSATPAIGPIGTTVTVAGDYFGATQGTSAVTFNGVPAAVTSWSASS